MLKVLRRSFSAMASSKLYEVRNYVCKPEQFQGFLKIAESEAYAERLKASLPYGVWKSDVGALNGFFHIWPYESLAQRAGVRAALAENKLWTGFYPRIAEMWSHQSNYLCKPVGEVLQTPPFSSGVYYSLFTQDDLGLALINDSVATSGNGTVAIMGQFRVMVGEPMGASFTLLNCQSADDGFEFLERNEELFTKLKTTSVLLYPHTISPLK